MKQLMTMRVTTEDVNNNIDRVFEKSAERIVAEITKHYIPIEWIKKKYNEADDIGMGIDDWSVKDCYGYVLEQWEKSKDARRQG